MRTDACIDVCIDTCADMGTDVCLAMRMPVPSALTAGILRVGHIAHIAIAHIAHIAHIACTASMVSLLWPGSLAVRLQVLHVQTRV